MGTIKHHACIVILMVTSPTITRTFLVCMFIVRILCMWLCSGVDPHLQEPNGLAYVQMCETVG